MTNLFDQLITVIIGSITTVTQAINEGRSAIEDFFYVRVSGLSFIVLGARQVGKTTLIEWLRDNMQEITEFEPEPTTAGGDEIDDFTSRVGGQHMKLKPGRDVGGEYAMWETDWADLFRETQPRGILFMMDHTDVHLQKDALNFIMQMIDDEPNAAANLKAIYVLVNKSDLWAAEMTLEDIQANYRNEWKRMRAQSERVGYKYEIFAGSLHTGHGVKTGLKQFFNIIRPKPRSKQEVA